MKAVMFEVAAPLQNPHDPQLTDSELETDDLLIQLQLTWGSYPRPTSHSDSE